MKNINLVKIWSDSIHEENIEKLLIDMALYEDVNDEKFIIISSGAVKLWKLKILEKWWNIDYISSSSLASIWQQYLMQMYDRLAKWKIVSQVLLDDYINSDYVNTFIEKVRDKAVLKNLATKVLWLVSEQKDKHLANTIADLVKNNVLVIINHNDATSNDELKNLSSKTDNDKNTIHITQVINNYSQEIWIKVKRVIFLTNTNWLLDERWETVKWWEIDISDNYSIDRYLAYIEKWKSDNGTWWMWSKVDCAFQVLSKWARESIIANSNSWLSCLTNEDYMSTKFLKKM